MMRPPVSYTHITSAQLAEMLNTKPAPYLLDVREPFELIAFGAVPGVVNIPMDEIPDRLDDLPADKSAQIVVICQSGSRSLEVSGFLARKGYTQVFNLKGGTYGWVISMGQKKT
jgi:rhodanese-related sulfurtransferase